MNTETPEKVARDMIAQADILAMMGEQPLSSLKAIEQLKKFAERILNAVKPDEHAARMDMVKPCEKPLDPNAPEMARGGERLAGTARPTGMTPEGDSSAEAQSRREKKAIGNFAGAGKVVSYAIDENFAVTVTARMADSRTWSFRGIKNGETVILGSIRGGGATAEKYCQFIRNGIVSRLMKIKQNHARRAERAARSDEGKEVAE